MPFDAFGNFTRSYNFTADKVAGLKIQSVRVDGECDNFTTGFNQVLLRNGVAPFTGDAKLGGFKITGVGPGTAGAPTITFTGDVTSGLFSPGAGSISMAAGGAEILRASSTGVAVTGGLTAGNITAGGNLVAGNITAGGNLIAQADIYIQRTASPNTGVLFFGNTATKYCFFDGTTLLWNGNTTWQGGTTYKFGAGGTLTASSANLTVDNTTGRAAQFANTSATATDTVLIRVNSIATSLIAFNTDIGLCGVINATSGTTCTYGTSSDPRLKLDFKPDIDPSRFKDFSEREGPLGRVCRVPSGSFLWEHDPDGARVSGFLTTNVEKERPEAVIGVAGAMEGLGNVLSWAGDTLQSDVPDPFAIPDGSTWALKAEVGTLYAVTNEGDVPVFENIVPAAILWDGPKFPANGVLEETTPDEARGFQSWTNTGLISVSKVVERRETKTEVVSTPTIAIDPPIEEGAQPTARIVYVETEQEVERVYEDTIEEQVEITVAYIWRKECEVGEVVEADGKRHRGDRMQDWIKTDERIRPQMLDHSKLVADNWGATQELAAEFLEERTRKDAIIADLTAKIQALRDSVSALLAK